MSQSPEAPSPSADYLQIVPERTEGETAARVLQAARLLATEDYDCEERDRRVGLVIDSIKAHDAAAPPCADG